MEALITSGPNKLRQLRALVQSNGKLSPATFTLDGEAGEEWGGERGGGAKAKAAGGGIFPLYLRRTVTAKNPLQAPNKRHEIGRQKYTLTKESLELESSYIILFYLIFPKYFTKSEKILSHWFVWQCPSGSRKTLHLVDFKTNIELALAILQGQARECVLAAMGAWQARGVANDAWINQPELQAHVTNVSLARHGPIPKLPKRIPRESVRGNDTSENISNT